MGAALQVTPFAGVWIEMLNQVVEKYSDLVTPFAGVWIEMSSDWGDINDTECHPLRGGV